MQTVQIAKIPFQSDGSPLEKSQRHKDTWLCHKMSYLKLRIAQLKNPRHIPLESQIKEDGKDSKSIANLVRRTSISTGQPS